MENGKVCTKCNEFKSFGEFHKSKRMADGHKSYCKDCCKEYMKKYWKQYYHVNSETLKEHRSKHYQENKEWNSQYRKKYQKSDRGKEAIFKAYLKRRSYKEKVNFTPIERKTIMNRDNWTCQSCGCKVHDRSTGNWNTPDKAHIDHIIPISKGGNSEPSNLQVLCRTCNLSKSDKILV